MSKVYLCYCSSGEYDEYQDNVISVSMDEQVIIQLVEKKTADTAKSKEIYDAVYTHLESFPYIVNEPVNDWYDRHIKYNQEAYNYAVSIGYTNFITDPDDMDDFLSNLYTETMSSYRIESMELS